jgi:ABC-type oligopeptide transport system substrate-binding subunit
MKLMKKLLGLSLVLASVVALAACKEDNVDQGQKAPDTYTMYSYSTGLATNWNPHTWENNSDSAFLSYIESPLVDLSIKNSATGEYQWVYEMATEIKDVTEDHTADLEKYGSTLPAGVESAAAVKSGYVYEIKLNPNAKWENGEVINADTYVYSMQQLLDSKMRNYRANNYYSGESAIAGAVEYFNSEAPIYDPVVPAYGEGETPDYSYDCEANDVYISFTRNDMTLAGYTFAEFKDDYGFIGRYSGRPYNRWL